MSKVLKMPGVGCRHYWDARCLYEEHLNPGLLKSWRCQVFVRLDERFERLVSREKSGLTLEQAGKIWHGWREAALSGPWDCPEYAYHADDVGEERCVYLYEDLCLLRIPVCPGRCSRFVCVAASCDE